MRGSTLLLCLVTTAAGCEDARFAALEQPIINGTVDTIHDAVVAVINQTTGFACTGTVIAVNGLDGYVLTAAHCAPAELVVAGDDYSAPTAVAYPVSAQDIDPQYNENDLGAGHDFSVVRFTGATAITPVIPAMTPAEDALAVGTPLTEVGYGVTESNPNNSVRRQYNAAVADLDGVLIQFDNTNGGACSGDSGGPALSAGTVRVAGVASFGDVNCTVFGGAGRVSAVYDSFIAPIIGGMPAVDAAPPGNDARPTDDAAPGPDADNGNPGDGDGGGCCDTGGDRGGAGAIALALVVGAVLTRRRKRA